MFKKTLLMTVSLLAMAACHVENPLSQRYAIDRAKLPEQALPNNPEAPAAAPLEMVNEHPTDRNIQTTVTVVTGTWTFTTPRTVTRVDKRDGESSQSSIYMGRPKPEDKPILVITVAPEGTMGAPAAGEGRKVAGERTYILNGNVAKETTGYENGVPFSELEIRRPGDRKTDRCYAIAMVRTAEERKTALEILSSIAWTPNPGPGETTP